MNPSISINTVVFLLLMYCVNLSISHKIATKRSNAFLNRKEIIWKEFTRNDYMEDELNIRRKRHADKPLHLSIHGQKHASKSDPRRNRRNNGSHFGSAIYFDGSGQLLKLRFLTKYGRIILPDEEFTIQFWAKPEGGQARYTPIIGK